MSARIQTEPFDISAEISELEDGKQKIGAIASFVGRVRAHSAQGPLESMELEHYPGMTEAELARIEQEAATRFKLTGSLIIHRVGVLKPGDEIVLVVTASSHRQDAFEACAFIMDYLKTQAPFWKKETMVNGESAWVSSNKSDDDAAERWK